MRRQGGYLSVLLLPLLTAMLLLTLAVISNGQELRQRYYRQTMVDNMAISAAVLMARELNILAIMNRALLANQLGIAQLIGIASWYQMLSSTSSRSATVTAWVPYLNTLTQQFNRVVQSVEEPLQRVLETGITLQHGLLRGIMSAQTMVRLSFATLVPKTLADIAKLHSIEEPQWQVLHSPGLFEFPLRWWTYIPRQRSGNDEHQLAQLMKQSLDPFSERRSYDWLQLGLVRVRKAGGTELQVDDAGRWSWQGLDTVSVHARILWVRVEIPWGAGASYSGDPIQTLNRQQFGYSAGTNPYATRLALAMQQQLASSTPSMHYYHRNDIGEHLPEILVVSGPQVAKAGVFFSRPAELFPRSDKRAEQANLFNALWQSQLQSLNATDKAVLLMLRAANS